MRTRSFDNHCYLLSAVFGLVIGRATPLRANATEEQETASLEGPPAIGSSTLGVRTTASTETTNWSNSTLAQSTKLETSESWLVKVRRVDDDCDGNIRVLVDGGIYGTVRSDQNAKSVECHPGLALHRPAGVAALRRPQRQTPTQRAPFIDFDCHAHRGLLAEWHDRTPTKTMQLAFDDTYDAKRRPACGIGMVYCDLCHTLRTTAKILNRPLRASALCPAFCRVT